MKGRMQGWELKFSEVTVDFLQHIAGAKKSADPLTRPNCTVLDAGRQSNWRNGPMFPKLPRESWPVSRYFRRKLPDAEIRRPKQSPTLSSLTLHSYYFREITEAQKKTRVRSQAPNLRKAAGSEESVKTGIDRSCALARPFKPPVAKRKSLYRTPTRIFSLRMTRTALARVCRTMARVANDDRLGGYLSYSQEELRAIVREPVSAIDYVQADSVVQRLIKARRKLNPVLASMG